MDTGERRSSPVANQATERSAQAGARIIDHPCLNPCETAPRLRGPWSLLHGDGLGLSCNGGNLCVVVPGIFRVLVFCVTEAPDQNGEPQTNEQRHGQLQPIV